MCKRKVHKKGTVHIDTGKFWDNQIKVIERDGEFFCYMGNHRICYRPFTSVYNVIYSCRRNCLKKINQLEYTMDTQYNNHSANLRSIQKDKLLNQLQVKLKETTEYLDKLFELKDSIATVEELPLIEVGKYSNTYKNLNRDIVSRDNITANKNY